MKKIKGLWMSNPFNWGKDEPEIVKEMRLVYQGKKEDTDCMCKGTHTDIIRFYVGSSSRKRLNWFKVKYYMHHIGPIPHLVKIGSVYYIISGEEQILGALIQGYVHIQAVVYDLWENEEEKQEWKSKHKIK